MILLLWVVLVVASGALLYVPWRLWAKSKRVMFNRAQLDTIPKEG